MAYTDPAVWVDGSVGGTPITAAALNLRDNNVRDHQTRMATAEALLARLSDAPVTVAYATSLTLNASQGSVFRVVATGDLSLSGISNGVDGQALLFEVFASGVDRVLTLPDGLDPIIVPAGTWTQIQFRYHASGDVWVISDSAAANLPGLLARLSTAPVTVAYATSLTLNAAAGCVFRVTATGDVTVADIVNGVDGQQISLEVLASGVARTVTVTGANRITVPAGRWGSWTFRYNATTGAWLAA